MSANEEQRIRIEELKRRIREATGEQPVFGTMNICPPDIEEAFLRNILEFETAEERSLLAWLQEAGMVVPNPDELDDPQLSLKLWEVIHALADLSVFLCNTNHLSDRELYRYLWSDELVEPVTLVPDKPDYSYTIDMVSSGSDEDLQLYLKYYADENERVRFAEHFPDMRIPAHCEPPYDRDRLLP